MKPGKLFIELTVVITHLLAELGHEPEQLGEAVEDEHELEVQLIETPAQVHLLVVDVAAGHLLAERHQLLVSLDGIETLKSKQNKTD